MKIVFEKLQEICENHNNFNRCNLQNGVCGECNENECPLRENDIKEYLCHCERCTGIKMESYYEE